jgi:hypothetical protein
VYHRAENEMGLRDKEVRMCVCIIIHANDYTTSSSISRCLLHTNNIHYVHVLAIITSSRICIIYIYTIYFDELLVYVYIFCRDLWRDLV